MYSLIIHGRRSLEVQKWRHLSVSLQNLFSSFPNSFSSVSDAATLNPPRNARKEETFTVSYLIDSLGFNRKLAQSISRNVSLEEKTNPDSVLSLFRSYGFTDSQISEIITNYPKVLMTDAERSLAPKLKFLQSRGASTSEFTEIVSRVPKILGKRKGKSCGRHYDVVRDVIEMDKSCNYENKSLAEGSKQENKIRNVLLLRELGVPQKLLFSLLISDLQPVCGKENFEVALKKVVEMGFNPTSANFVNALHVFYESSDKTIQEKVNVYKELGFTLEQVWGIFRKWPYSLKFSEKKIRQTLETLKKCGLSESEVLFVLNKYPQTIRNSEQKVLYFIETFLGLGISRDEFAMIVKQFPQVLGLSPETVKKKIEIVLKNMNWPLQALITCPSVFGYSMEKRIIPRCRVIKALVSKGLSGSELPSLSYVLACSDEVFLKHFVRKHDDKQFVTALMATFTKSGLSLND